MRITPDGDGGVHEQPLPVRLLPHAEGEDAPRGRTESDGVAELRALRAGRRRWD
jgi:hypothetical protein